MSKTPTFKTVNELTSAPTLSLACAQIDPAALRADIMRCLDGLRRVNSPQAQALADHFAGIVNRADPALTDRGPRVYAHELKRVALGLSCVAIGDL